MNHSEQLNELAEALSKAQSEIVGALADSKNPFYKSNYADLTSVWNAIRGPLTKNGLSVSQVSAPHENGVEIESVLLHKSGQWLSGSLFMPADKLTPQDFGKLVTYCRRYSLTALVGVPQLDDDAESAMNREVEIKEVKEIKQDKAPTATKPAHQDHECRWLVSKFNKNEEYCPQCKSKRPRKHAS